MGNLLSNPNNINNYADNDNDNNHNNDRYMRKEEFEMWNMRQKNELETFKQTLLKMKEMEYNDKMNDLMKQIETLKTFNLSLEEKIKQTTENKDENNENNEKKETRGNKILSETSKRRIEEIAERMIQNEAMNIKYLPDFVERQIYKNMLNIVIGLLNEIIEGGKIEILEHEITLKMEAK